MQHNTGCPPLCVPSTQSKVYLVLICVWALLMHCDVSILMVPSLGTLRLLGLYMHNTTNSSTIVYKRTGGLGRQEFSVWVRVQPLQVSKQADLRRDGASQALTRKGPAFPQITTNKNPLSVSFDYRCTAKTSTAHKILDFSAIIATTVPIVVHNITAAMCITPQER